MPSVGKIEKLQRQRSARRDKSSGPLPFLFDVLYFCIFKIHFPSQIQLCFYLSSRFGPDMPLRFSFATILPPESRNPVFLFKIDFPSQIQIRVYLSIIKILPGFPRIWVRPP